MDVSPIAQFAILGGAFGYATGMAHDIYSAYIEPGRFPVKSQIKGMLCSAFLGAVAGAVISDAPSKLIDEVKEGLDARFHVVQVRFCPA